MIVETFSRLLSVESIDFIARIFVAMVAGGAIGLERGRKNRPAGLRTHMVTCIAAALVMVTNEYILMNNEFGDPTRMGAQVISGVGFLGAGTIIIDRQNRIRGLTTAAGLWASACVGLAIGGGFYLGGIVATILIISSFSWINVLEHKMLEKSRLINLTLWFKTESHLNKFLTRITSISCNVVSFDLISKSDANPTDESGVQVELVLWLPSRNSKKDVLNVVEKSQGSILSL